MQEKNEIYDIIKKVSQELGEGLNISDFNNQKNIYPPDLKRENKARNKMIVVTGFGHDKPGILASITVLLAEYNINIIDMTQKILEDVFTIIIIADTEKMTIEFDTLKLKLKELSQKIGVRFEAQNYMLFEIMHRV